MVKPTVTQPGIIIWGLSAGGSRREAQIGDLRDDVPQKLKQFADVIY